MSLWRGGLWGSQRGGGGGAIDMSREISFPEDLDGDGVLTGDEIGATFTVRVRLSDIAVEGDTLDVSAMGSTESIVLAEADITAGQVESVFDTPAGAEQITASAQLHHTSSEDSKVAGTLRPPGTPQALYDSAEGVTLYTVNRSSAEEGKYVYRSTSPMDPQALPAPLDTLAAGAESYLDTTAVADQTYYYRLASFKGGMLQVSEELEFLVEEGGSIIGVALVDDTVQGGSFVWIDEAGNEIAQPSTTWFDGHPSFDLTDETIDGQALVRVPKSYWKRDQIEVGAHGTCDCWWVSPVAAAGFQVFPAFEVGGGEVDQFWIGKYEGYLDGESKLASQAAVTPTASRSWTQFQTDAEARNVGGVEGFRQVHYDMRACISWLYLVEHGSFDSQATTAQGNVSSGSVQLTDSADNAAASYRGIYALWGNLSEWTDGLRHVDGAIDRRGYGGGTWSSTGVTRPTTSLVYMDTVKTAAAVADLFVAETWQGSEAGATVPDYHYWANSGERVAHCGGFYSNGGVAGLWYLDVSNTATDALSAIGSRLARVV